MIEGTIKIEIDAKPSEREGVYIEFAGKIEGGVNNPIAIQATSAAFLANPELIDFFESVILFSRMMETSGINAEKVDLSISQNDLE